MSRLKISADRGIYTLVIEMSEHARLRIGKLGEENFKSGIYAYTGSAMGKATNLQNRVCRHLKTKKKMHWHIDYLLNSEVETVKEVIFVLTHLRRECQLAGGIKQLAQTEVEMRGFGASDCHSGCISHLHFFPNLLLWEVEPLIVGVYKKFFGESIPIAVLG